MSLFSGKEQKADRQENGKSDKFKLPDVHIHLIIPLSSTIQFDAANFEQRYLSRWNSKMICKKAELPTEYPYRSEKFLFGDGRNQGIITYIDGPMDEGLLGICLNETKLLSPSSTEVLEKHRAHMLVEYLFGGESALERVRCAAKVLLTIIESNQSIGVFNFSGQMFRTKNWINSFFKDSKILDSLEIPALYFLFTGVQIEINGQYWVHTHGMEQFELPDMEIRVMSENEINYCKGLLFESICHNIENNGIFKPGDTFEMKGDDKIYRFKESEDLPDHPYGQFGSIEFKLK